MNQPFFNPPYDSPIEERFAYHAVKYLDERIKFVPQYEVTTICGRFVVDFVAETESGYKIGFECDGKEFHDESRDEWRDAMILGADAVHTMYRLKGSDITYHLDDVLFVLSFFEPEIFSERGRINLTSLASESAKRTVTDQSYKSGSFIFIHYFDERTKKINLSAQVFRLRKYPGEGRREFWPTLFEFAKSEGGGNLDDLRAEYRRRKGFDSPDT